MSEASTSGTSNILTPKGGTARIWIPPSATEIHMLYGDAEKDGPTSKCIMVDIKSHNDIFNFVGDGPLKIVHIWFKPPMTTASCNKVIIRTMEVLPKELPAVANDVAFVDTLDTAEVGANVAVADPHIFNEDFRFDAGEDVQIRDIPDLEGCSFCPWTGSRFAMDNHYIKVRNRRRLFSHHLMLMLDAETNIKLKYFKKY